MDNIKNSAIAIAAAIILLLGYFIFMTAGQRKEMKKIERSLSSANKKLKKSEKKFLDFLYDEDIDPVYEADPDRIDQYAALLDEQIQELRDHAGSIEQISLGNDRILNMISRLTMIREEGVDISLVSYSEDKLTKHQLEGKKYNQFNVPIRINSYFSQLVNYLNYCVSQNVPVAINSLKIRSIGERVQTSFDASWLVVEGSGNHEIPAVADALRNYNINLNRDVFLRKVEKKTIIEPPVLKAEGLETPEDINGTFSLIWNKVPDVIRYDLIMNNEIYQADAKTPVEFRGIDDGDYEFKVNAVFVGMIERMSNIVTTTVKIPPPDLPEFHGTVKYNNIMLAQIDDQVLKEDDKHKGFKIVTIETESVLLEEIATGKQFELNLLGPWSAFTGKEKAK